MPRGVYVRTKEYREKISKANKGHVPWNKNLQEYRCKVCDVVFYDSLSRKRKYCNDNCVMKGKIHGMLGKHHTLKIRNKMSKAKRGDKCHTWKGGITPLTKRIRVSFEYRLWRSDVYHRDKFTCQECGGNKSGSLIVHHIKQFAQIFMENDIKTFEQAIQCEEFWDINNGLTLCNKCHELTKKDKTS